ncbi:aspartic peptidase domain-containing protein [Trametes maxima]|nr:aspartic peptidase domain-containing protein [Trametes maxima]
MYGLLSRSLLLLGGLLPSPFAHASPVGSSTLAPNGGAFPLQVHRSNNKRFDGSNTTIPGDIGLTNNGDIVYLVNITLGGQDYSVQVDTGSHDLWVNSQGRDMHFTNQTDLIGVLPYGSGVTRGPEVFAELRLGDFVVPSQAFINATELEGTEKEIEGILGMAFDYNGAICLNFTLSYGLDAAGELCRAPITNIWAQNPTVPPYFDILLSRADPLADADAPAGDGLFLIGQHAPGYERVAAAPKLPRVDVQHWSVALDGVSINGAPFAFSNGSAVSGAPADTIVATLDTGATLAVVPAALAEALYGSIPGAVLVEGAQSFWAVPCNSSANVTVKFGGQDFPIHPLDLTQPLETEVEIPGTNVTFDALLCRGSFTPVTPKLAAFNAFDLLLGDTFLKNVYVSYNYGDNYDRKNLTNFGLPYVQMLPVTERETAWAEWLSVRAQTLMASPPALPPAVLQALPDPSDSDNSTSSDPDSDSNSESESVSGALSTSDSDKDDSSSFAKKYGPLAVGLLGANLALGVLALGVVLAMCVRGVRGSSSGSGPRYAPVRAKEEAAGSEPFEETHLKYGD